MHVPNRTPVVFRRPWLSRLNVSVPSLSARGKDRMGEQAESAPLAPNRSQPVRVLSGNPIHLPQPSFRKRFRPRMPLGAKGAFSEPPSPVLSLNQGEERIWQACDDFTHHPPQGLHRKGPEMWVRTSPKADKAPRLRGFRDRVWGLLI